MNDPRNMHKAMQAVISMDGHAQGTISYTTSPVHTIDLWVDLAKKIETTLPLSCGTNLFLSKIT